MLSYKECMLNVTSTHQISITTKMIILYVTQRICDSKLLINLSTYSLLHIYIWIYTHSGYLGFLKQ